jgi:hypothetical protein
MWRCSLVVARRAFLSGWGTHVGPSRKCAILASKMHADWRQIAAGQPPVAAWRKGPWIYNSKAKKYW